MLGAQASPPAGLPIQDLIGQRAGEDACAPSTKVIRAQPIKRFLSFSWTVLQWRKTALLVKSKTEPGGIVSMRTGFGGTRIVDMLVGEQLPRIC